MLDIFRNPEDGGHVVAINDVWLPGVYDSFDTAERASRLPHETLDRINDAHEYGLDCDRHITTADLDTHVALISASESHDT